MKSLVVVGWRGAEPAESTCSDSRGLLRPEIVTSSLHPEATYSNLHIQILKYLLLSAKWDFTTLTIQAFSGEDLTNGLTGPLSSGGASRLAERVKKSRGALQRLRAFILFKTTDSTNHAFDWTNLLGSGGGIISSVKWFSRRGTPELWNKTNQENHRFDFDQSGGAELWISGDEAPAANQHCWSKPCNQSGEKGHLLEYHANCLSRRLPKNWQYRYENEDSCFCVRASRDRRTQKVGTFRVDARENTAQIMQLAEQHICALNNSYSHRGMVPSSLAVALGVNYHSRHRFFLNRLTFHSNQIRFSGWFQRVRTWVSYLLLLTIVSFSRLMICWERTTWKHGCDKVKQGKKYGEFRRANRLKLKPGV